MAHRKRTRLYPRHQGGVTRYYADFRDLGGGREALKPEGEVRATTDRDIAESLVAERLKELQEQKRDRVMLGVKRRAGLLEYSAEHLEAKGSSSITGGWLGSAEHHLEVAGQFFCNAGKPLPRTKDGKVDVSQVKDRDLATIGVEHVRAFAQWLTTLPNRRKGTLSPTTQRQYLNSLSNLFRRAQSESIVRGVNPVQALMDKPGSRTGEANFLEVWEAALLLEAARTYPYGIPTEDATAGGRLAAAIAEVLAGGPAAKEEFVRRMRVRGKLLTMEKLERYLEGKIEPTKEFMLAAAEALELPAERLHRPRGWNKAHDVSPMAYPLIATYLLTGGRETEVYGLTMGDVNLERGTVAFRVNKHRRLKTRTSARIVPLWPQLREILSPYLEQRQKAGATPDDLLFPSPITGGLLADSRKMLDSIATTVGWQPGDIRTKMFRHTYCAARLQTLDRGHPVSIFSVGKELGHGGEALVKRVYGHLGQVPHRSEFVEYRIEQQREVIPPERLRLLLRAS